jgi:hypothetical protein
MLSQVENTYKTMVLPVLPVEKINAAEGEGREKRTRTRT